MRELKKKKIEYAEHFAEIFPYITPILIGKHLFPEVYKKNPYDGQRYGSIYLKRLEQAGKIVRAYTSDVIYVKKGRSKNIGMKNYPHNQAVISFLINCILWGYEARIGGDKQSNASDAIVWANGKYYVETDRNHHGPKALNAQITKYQDKKCKGILYFVYPQGKVTLTTRENTELQWAMEKEWRKKAGKHPVPTDIKDKLYSTTYTQCADPFTDPLTATIWRKGLKQDFVSVLQ